ncbi:MAG: GTP cyclohydrolase I FolE [Chlamydiales bacterium]
MNVNDPAVTRFPHPVKREKVEISAEIKKAKIEEKIGEILEILGLDLDHPSLTKIPSQIAKSYIDEFFSGLDPRNFPKISFYEEKSQQLIAVKNISFVSFCEHHLVPIQGVAHVAYYPQKKIIGLSNINQIVRYFAKRPQLQERLTAQIADSLASLLETEDVGVIISAKHFCMHARNAEDNKSEIQTSVLRGKLLKERHVFL